MYSRFYCLRRWALLCLSVVSLSASASFTDLIYSMIGNKSDLLTVEEAFPLELAAEGKQLMIRSRIADGYYLYQNRLKFELDGEEIHPVLPKGKQKDDPLFGDVLVYIGLLEVPLPKVVSQSLSSVLVVSYQGCADIGVCYPPAQMTFPLSDAAFLLAGSGSDVVSQTVETVAAPNASALTSGISEIQSRSTQLADSLDQGRWWVIIPLFFFAGVLLSFSPCVLPLIPILFGVLTRQGEALTPRRSFMLSLVFVLSIAFVYSLLGVFSASLGQNLQVALQNPWVLSSFSLVFVGLAFSMFGFYELQIPIKWQNKLNMMGNKQKTGTYFGTAIMGALSALIVGPCVAPPLAASLLYIGQTGDALLGGVALFALSLGMGSLLLVYGALGGKYLPKSGAWMENVKRTFGVLMIAMAVFFLDRVVPIWLSMFLWGALLIISAVYIRAFEAVQRDDSSEVKLGWLYLRKGIALLLFILGVVQILGVASGGRSVLQPMKHIASSNGTSSYVEDWFEPVSSGPELIKSLQTAVDNQMPAMVYVTADWCISCDELDLMTFNDSRVISAMTDGSVVALKVDVSTNNGNDKIMAKNRRVVGPPTIIFYDRRGKEIESLRSIGVITPTDLISLIQYWKSI